MILRQPICFVWWVAELGWKARPCATLSAALDDGANVLIDLSDCEHLDSTFLGCLVMLQRHSARAEGEFHLYADERARQRLFGTCRLDQILSFTDQLPTDQGSAVVLPVPNLPRREYCEHLLDTHRQLAELGGPSAETFQRIVDQLKSELDKL